MMNNELPSDEGISERHFVQLTGELKTLITQAKSSGTAAWQAGEMFYEIKSSGIYKRKYNSFESYIEKEFGITDQTANNYIRIHQSFDLEEIGDLIFSNLKAIAEIQNINVRKQVVNEFVNSENKSFRVKDVITTVAFIGNRSEVSSEEIKEIIKDVLPADPIPPPPEPDPILPPLPPPKPPPRPRPEKYGKSFDREECKFPIYELIEREPINEMGLVAIFCIIFQWLKNKSFEHYKYNGALEFCSMRYIQVAFPDITLICKLNKKKSSSEFIDLKAEFEYKSRNYLEHEHHKSTKECDLIICWEDNVRNDNEKIQSDVVKRMPPILELKEFLKTGEIYLRI